MVSSSILSPLRRRSSHGQRSRSSSPAPHPTSDTAQAPVQTDRAGTMPGMSACEMFPLFKALAAAKRGKGIKARIASLGKSAVDDTGDSSSDEEEADEHGEEAGNGQRPASTDSQMTLAARPALDRQQTRSSQMDKQADWVQQDLGETEALHEATARKFAAISLESPIHEKIEADVHQQRAADGSIPGATISGPGHLEPGQGIDLHLSDEQKLAAIVDEFGEVASTVVGPDGQVEEERILAHTPGIMFKGVMMVGNIHLTTHRLLFHAPLPPDEAFVRKYSATGEDGHVPAFDKPVTHTDILHSGPVTWHRSGPLTSAQRVWLELSAEMITTYPSADDVGRTRPLKSILLTSIRKFDPLDPDRPSDFIITYEGPSHPLVAHFTVDTEQSASAWRRDMEAAMYRLMRKQWRQVLLHNRHLEEAGGFGHSAQADKELREETDETKWSMLRYCVPLDKVSIVGTDDYHGLGLIVSLEVQLGQQKALFEAELVAQGEYSKALQVAYAPDDEAQGEASSNKGSQGAGQGQAHGSGSGHGLLHCLGPGYGSGHASPSSPNEGADVKRRLSLPKLYRRLSGNKDRPKSGASTPSRLGPNAHTAHSHDGQTHAGAGGHVHDLARHITELQKARQASRDASGAGVLGNASPPMASPEMCTPAQDSAIASAPGSPLGSPSHSRTASHASPLTTDLAAAQASQASPETAVATPEQKSASGKMFMFNIVVLNDWAAFIDPLRKAIDHARTRHPVEGKAQAQTVLNIAGMDMLATDEEIEAIQQAREAHRVHEEARRKRHREQHKHHLHGPDHHSSGGADTAEADRHSDSEDYDGDEIDNEDEIGHSTHDQQRGLGMKGTVKSVGHAASAAAKRVRKAEKTHMMAREFGLKEEDGIWIKRSYVIHTGIAMRGHIVVTPRFFCFWRRMLMSHDIKYRFKTTDIKDIQTVSLPAQPQPYGLALKLHAQHDVQFVFWHRDARDEVLKRVRAVLDAQNDSAAEQREPISSAPVTPVASHDASASASEASPLSPTSSSTSSDAPQQPPPELARTESDSTPTSDPFAPHAPAPGHAADILAPPRGYLFTKRTFPDELLTSLPFLANKPWLSRTSTISPRTFACLTIGSRGDVQPYIALGVRLLKDGHKVVIITHEEFKEWVQGYGIEHRQAGGDPTVLMKFSSDHSMLSPGFFKEALGTMRQWLDDLLLDAWKACHDVDVLIESPSAMAGVHIAEARKIPYFRAFTMPWNRTSAYPQAFMVPAFDMGPSFNYSTYTLYDNVIWTATSGQINKWRKKHLGLPPTSNNQLSTAQIPYLYNFSEAVVPKPLDWSDAVNITGYWTLENSDTEWTPPEGLERFMQKARDDGKALVYIGFGSIVVSKPNQVTKSIIEAVERAGVCAIIAKGWSSRGGDPSEEGQEIEFPDSCYSLEKVPHGWLFPKIDAAMHHGGAGTTGASLGAGLPTIIKPFFGDQYFWALRVTKLGVGLKATSFRASDMASALKKVTTDTVMREKAARVGRAIRRENGVENALEAIHFNIVRAAADRGSLRFNK